MLHEYVGGPHLLSSAWGGEVMLAVLLSMEMMKIGFLNENCPPAGLVDARSGSMPRWKDDNNSCSSESCTRQLV